MPRTVRQPKSARGRELLGHIEKKGLTLIAACRKAKVNHGTLRNLIQQEPPPKVHYETAMRLHTSLEVPMRLIVPGAA